MRPKLHLFCRAPSVFSILLLLLRDSSNFKIRIQAPAALAVPPTILESIISRGVASGAMHQSGAAHIATMNHKKDVILKAVQSLVVVYDGRNHLSIARRFEKLANSIL